MTDNINVLIFDWRFIVAKGIECTLKNHFSNLLIKIVLNDEDFVSEFKHFSPHVIFINEKKISPHYELIERRELRLVVIGRGPVRLNREIAFYLPLNVNSNYLVSNFNEKVEKFFFPEADQEGDLTAREREIVKLIALGYTNQQIADELFISPHTVITHRKNITRKLGIKTISGLTIYAILNNLIKLEDIEGEFKS